jgi:hypothetical protein
MTFALSPNDLKNQSQLSITMKIRLTEGNLRIRLSPEEIQKLSVEKIVLRHPLAIIKLSVEERFVVSMEDRILEIGLTMDQLPQLVDGISSVVQINGDQLILIVEEDWAREGKHPKPME